jgi:NTE family protein
MFSAPILLGACANPVVYNEGKKFDLEERAFDQSHPAYTFQNYAETPRVPRLKPDLIVMTLSGGGIRAAALAAAVMNELHRFEINGAPITDNVILVSSTSGGSLAAGYFAVHGFDHYADFRSQFLEKQNTRDLLLRGLGPRLFYDRSAVFQEFIEERLDLKGMTFGQLIQRHDRPFFVMNSTDLSTGEAFAFVQHDFSSICTNLNAMPISVGMTASAAIPFLLTDVELRNRNSECANEVKSEVLPAYFFDARDAVAKRYKYNLRHAFDDTAPNPQRPRPVFIHLADGGLVDNLGVGGADDADIDAASSLSAQIDPSSQVSAIRQVLVIEVNARNEKQHDDLNRDRGSPGLISMLGLTINTPIDRATSLSDGALKVGMEAVESMRPYVTDGVHVTQIDFDLIGDDEADLRRRVKGINTSLTLMPGELADLEKVAKSLLRKSGCFAQYVDRSGAKADDYISPGADRNVTGFPYDCQ